MTTEQLAQETDSLRHGAGAFRARRDFLAARGPEAVPYLQGQLSQDVEALAVGECADSLVLEPDGKLCALVRVTRTGDDELVLDVEGGFGEAVAARLRRFLLRSKVEISPLDWRCTSVRGSDAGPTTERLRHEAPERGLLVLPFEWNGWVGVDVLGGAAAVPDLAPPGSPDANADYGRVRTCGHAAVEACRIVSGLPAMGAELTERTIPAEVGLVERTVSFTKGCYTGQELVARIDARGSHVPRRLVGVTAPGAVTDAPSLAPGMTLHAGEAPAGDAPAADKVVGSITSAAWSVELGCWVALASLHRSVEAPGPVRVRSGDGTGGWHPARVDVLPLHAAAGCGRSPD